MPEYKQNFNCGANHLRIVQCRPALPARAPGEFLGGVFCSPAAMWAIAVLNSVTVAPITSTIDA
jgi:hypothetical protein